MGRKLSELLAGIVLGFLIAEVGLRVFAARRDLTMALAAPRPLPPPGAKLEFTDLLEPDPNPRLLYRQRPRVRGRFLGAEVSINALGFRGPETTVEKPPGVRRIVGLGDSVMWGWRVAADDRYLDQLARRLSADGVPTEAVNLAVPGYNTVQEVETLATRGLAFGPDVVVLELVENDLDPPLFVWGVGDDPWTLRRSVLAARLAQTLGWPGTGASLPLIPYFAERPAADGTPGSGAAIAGRAGFFDAMDRLRDLARARGIPVVALPFRSEPDQQHDALDLFEAASRERGFVVCDTRPTVRRELAAHGLAPSNLWVAPKDVHPTPRGHRLVAEALEAAIRGPAS